MDQFQKEQNELLEYMIKNVYFNRFDKTKNNNKFIPKFVILTIDK